LLGMGDTSAVRLLAPPVLNLSSCPIFRVHFTFSKRGLTISFNGEIYNYRDLRKELGRDVDFVTDSDTEVLVEAWRAWGMGCLSRLRGMFAFAVHEEATGKVWLCRDRFGIKPLFYLPLPGGGLAFASELKAIEAAFRPYLTLDRNALIASLLYVWLPENRCVWKEVRKLLPGHYLEVSPGGETELHRWWSLANPRAPEFFRSEGDALEALGTVLEDSVRAHLVSDVPVSAFLSGGLDSSLIVAMAARELSGIDCYTIRFRDRDQRQEAMTEDSVYAGRVADYLGVRLETIEVAPDLAELLPRIVGILDEPIGDSAAINTLLICEAARQQGVKVLLSGLGADELFGGYRKHLAGLWAARYRSVPHVLRRHVIEPLVRATPVASGPRGLVPIRWAKRFIGFGGLPANDAFLRSYSYYGAEEFGELLEDDDGSAFATLRNEHHALFDAAGDDPVNRMCLVDTRMFMTSLNLTYTDRAGMAAATEVRVPFIDREVVDLAMRIPGTLKIRGSTHKYVLKKVAERWLPQAIVHRSKSSFTLPLRAWLKDDLRGLVADYVLSEQGLPARGLFNSTYLHRLVESDRAGRDDNAQRIWQLLTLEQWFRNHGIAQVG